LLLLLLARENRKQKARSTGRLTWLGLQEQEASLFVIYLAGVCLGSLSLLKKKEYGRGGGFVAASKRKCH
jgi:hypothetical protein